jgi:thymidine phosphorylase
MWWTFPEFPESRSISTVREAWGIRQRSSWVLWHPPAAFPLLNVRQGAWLYRRYSGQDGIHPGFRTSLEAGEFISLVNRVGLSVIGQTAHIAPADKKLYALRDVTATVDNLSLITSSIMSKKLASGSDAIVLDVKCGRGAFMERFEDACTLGEMMVEIGKADGKKTIAVITDMNQPLGLAVGNSLEVIEAIETLKGKDQRILRSFR